MAQKINVGVLLVGFIMLMSTVGFALMGSNSQSDSTPKTEMPEKNIIDYALTDAQKTLLISNGITIAEYLYDPKEKCDSCAEIKNLLEVLSSQFQDQIMLSEIQVSASDYVDLPRVEMTSAVGAWTPRGNVTAQSVLDGFCTVAVYPPIGCALSKLPQSNASKGI